MSHFPVRRLCSVAAVLSLGLCLMSPVGVHAADAAADAASAPAAPAPAAPAPTAPAPAAVAPAPAPVAAAPAPAPVAVAPAPAPVILGSYDVSGVNAVDKKPYEGVAIITKKGEAYQVNYEDSDGKYMGVAFYAGNVLGIAYASENKPTICLMEPDGTTGWKGQYIERGENFLSKELWKRR